MNKNVVKEKRQKKPMVIGVICLLVKELLNNCKVEALENRVLVTLSKADFEFRLGNILQQIYQIVDDHFPDRRDDIAIIIRDQDNGHENVFKIWKSVQFID